MSGSNEALMECVDRLLNSESLRNAPSSRRLLSYLAEKTISGEADQLKEYTIGIDAFSKTIGYDPRHDSTVRIQVGRLRHKFVEYYQGEGRDDDQCLALPKGRFRLEIAPKVAGVLEIAAAPERRRWQLAAIALGVLLAASLLTNLWLSRRLAMKAQSPVAQSWTTELDELWRPFLTPGRPLLIAVGSPLFLQFENKALYRDLSIESFDDLKKSANFAAVSKALASKESRPVHYYAAIGDLGAALALGQRLGPLQPSMSLVRSTELLWQQMADANVLFLGPPRFFRERLGSLPVALEIIETPDGFRVLKPGPGEPELFKYRDPPGFFAEDGEACVLVTRVGGPQGNAELETVASNSTSGRLGAIQSLTDPGFARELVRRMSNGNSSAAGGAKLPRYFQLLLRVKYKSGVPTETTYLMHRELVRHP